MCVYAVRWDAVSVCCFIIEQEKLIIKKIDMINTVDPQVTRGDNPPPTHTVRNLRITWIPKHLPANSLLLTVSLSTNTVNSHVLHVIMCVICITCVLCIIIRITIKQAREKKVLLTKYTYNIYWKRNPRISGPAQNEPCFSGLAMLPASVFRPAALGVQRGAGLPTGRQRAHSRSRMPLALV